MNSQLTRTVRIAAIALWATSLSAASGPGYHLVNEIKIGGEGSWDYLSVDSAARRLYVTHDSELIAIDLDKNSVVGKVTGLSGLHGFAIASGVGHGFATNGRDNSVSVVDLKTLQVLSKVATGQGPDAIAFDPSRQEVYAFNGRGQSATVIDAKTNQVVATIALPGKPESGVVDSAAKRVYVNIESASVVAVIDTSTHAMVAKWPTAPCAAPVGMAIDAANKRLLIGCDSQHLIMMDSTTGQVLSSVPIDEAIDAAAFDGDGKLAFTSNGEGTVTIAHEDSASKLSVVQTLKTVEGARTMALDSKTHNIYLSVATRQGGANGAQGMQAGMNSGPPPGGRSVVADSFKVLVYAPGT